MNMTRFTGRTSREAMQKVRDAFGEDAIVLSNKPCPGGVEVLAMPPHGLDAIEQHREELQERMAQQPPVQQPQPRARAAQGTAPTMREMLAPPAAAQAAERVDEHATVQDDVKRLSMSTLSFQDYVRDRLLKRRQVALGKGEPRHVEPSFDMPAADEPPAQALAQRLAQRAQERAQVQREMAAQQRAAAQAPVQQPVAQPQVQAQQSQPARREPPVLREEVPMQPAAYAHHQAHQQAQHVQQQAHQQPAQRPAPQQAWAASAPSLADQPQAHQPQQPQRQAAAQPQQPAPQQQPRPPSGPQNAEMMQELRTMKGLIEERFGAIAFLEKLQRSPSNAHLTQKLLDCGFSPALIRKLVDAMPPEVTDGSADGNAWAAEVLERNLLTGEHDPAIEDQGGVFAMVGATGVGKTTSTAKIAAAFAAKHGAANLGLITLDAYRVGAHEQLRAYGRILGVPVHTAHDRAALEDLLDLLSAKKMVLIDTAGLAQRDSRARELLDMLGGRIKKLVVVNAAAQGETIDDVLVAYQASAAAGVVLSKLDEAVKLGPALDALIRHRLKVVGVANGQRVPEDWHRLSGRALVHRALRSGGSPAYRLDPNEVNLVFTTPSANPAAMAAQMQAHAQAQAQIQAQQAQLAARRAAAAGAGSPAGY
jgi:flagellar biosynthesis protein FlhF